MRRNDTGLLVVFALIIGALAVAVGCTKTQNVIPDPGRASPTPTRSLEALKRKITDNARAFRSLEADCDVNIRSRAFADPIELRLSGTLKLVKPRKIHLRLTLAGHPGMELIGDGKNYQVRMPAFENAIHYGGKYDTPLTPVPDQIHFMPDDVADAFDLTFLFAGKAQVLKAYPAGYDIFRLNFRQPSVNPALWHIDSIGATRAAVPAFKVINSVTIDRQTEQLLRLDKFELDGSLRTRIWYGARRLVHGPEGATAEIPSKVMISYPEPLEGTVIFIQLRRMKINTDIPEGNFVLTD